MVVPLQLKTAQLQTQQPLRQISCRWLAKSSKFYVIRQLTGSDQIYGQDNRGPCTFVSDLLPLSGT